MTDEWEDWWVFRLSQNLMGYGSIAIPGTLLVRYLKRTKYLESRDNGCFFRYMHTFVHGQEECKPVIESSESTPSTHYQSEQKTYQRALTLLFCFLGLQVSYLAWGVLQEKIMTQGYRNDDGDVKKFSDSQFLVFVNRVLAFFFAGTYISFSKQPLHTAPFYKYSYCSFSNIMSSWCQYEALKYVSFPTQVLAKASKIIPVMLMGKLVSKKTYKCHEYATAIVISVGMTLFLWSREQAITKVTATTASGVVILLAYMVSDSFTSNWQGELFKQYHMSSVQMMCGVNFFSCIFTSISLLQQGGFSKSLLFFVKFPTFFGDCIILSICSTIGQLFIFYTISRFGPVAFVIMMTVRQALAILLSCLIYNHTLTISGILGIVIVFSAVFLRIYLNNRKKARLNQNVQMPVSNDQKV